MDLSRPDGRLVIRTSSQVPFLVRDELCHIFGLEPDGVRVFTIAYGPDADLATLQEISEASRAAAYDARNPTSIDKVFSDVLSNF